VHSLLVLTVVLLISISIVVAGQTSDSAQSDYRCDQAWSGPAIGTKGVVLPLPIGYSLVDRTAQPHIFNNFVESMRGDPLGTIAVGHAPGYLDIRSFSDSEFSSDRSEWKEAIRETLQFRETGFLIETFAFPDGMVLEFSGAGLKFAESMASCYSTLLPLTIDMDKTYFELPR
jgi:hypothetical protein